MKTKTSQDSPIGINHLTPRTPGGAWAAITLAPGKNTQGHSCYWKRDLQVDLDKLRRLGTTVLAPLLEDDELVSLKIPNLVEEAEKRKFEVRRFPFHDGGIPKDMDKARQFISELIVLIQTGERIVIHCNGGLGRAGTIGACLRLATGLDDEPREAIKNIRKIRAKRAIEGKRQEQFIERFHRAWMGHRGDPNQAKCSKQDFLETENPKDMENEPVFYLEKNKGAYEPLYIPPSMGDECSYMCDLHKPHWEIALVRLNDGLVRPMHVLAVTGDGLHDLYLPWSRWETSP